MLQNHISGRHLLVATLGVLLLIAGLWYFWIMRPALPSAQAASGAQPLRHSPNGNFKVEKP